MRHCHTFSVKLAHILCSD